MISSGAGGTWNADGRVQVVRAVRALAGDPFARGSRKLTGYDDVFRIRAGRYRVPYSAGSAELVVVFLKPGQRRNVYR
ncbi:MAG: type II toxin-antitoxin system RelE/ParE family toxin [Proteobacteria bacterium]|nr:type II toxin-antitoxin system RelE/ParE family toxin [Pseudomonadota bacterium]